MTAYIHSRGRKPIRIQVLAVWPKRKRASLRDAGPFVMQFKGATANRLLGALYVKKRDFSLNLPQLKLRFRAFIESIATNTAITEATMIPIVPNEKGWSRLD